MTPRGARESVPRPNTGFSSRKGAPKMRKIVSMLGGLAALALLMFAAQPAAAQYVGQPGWLSDPTNVCSYVGRSGCAQVTAGEPLPYGGTAVTSSSGNVAAATAAATLPAVSAKTTYLSGFMFTSSGSTGALVVDCTVTGLISGTWTFSYTTVAGATLANAPLVVNLERPIPGSAVNTAIVVSCPTLGAGNAHAAMTAWGFNR